MATTNLQTQSLGGILIESGAGTPDHTSPKGSYYTNTSTGSLFINNDGTSTGWEILNKVAWGEMYIQSNTTTITLSAANLNWTSLTGLTNWVYAGGNGTEMSQRGKLKIKSNKGGTYFLLATATIQIQNVASAWDFFIGVGKNGPIPSNGFFQACMLNGALSATVDNEDDKTLSITNIVSLNTNDTLELSFRVPNSTPDFRLETANIFIYRIGD